MLRALRLNEANETPVAPPLVTAVDMGYGHLRPATALADALGVEIMRCDQPPLADAEEARKWRQVRRPYEAITRWTGLPLVGRALHELVERFTDIEHLHPHRDQSAPDFAVKRLHRMIEQGLGQGLGEALRDSSRPLLTTYFISAFAAEQAGCEDIWLVVTDSDIHRVWAPLEPQRTKINYLVPSMRALRRLRAYGVPKERIHVTGFPLPGELLGGEDLPTLRRDLAARLVRLDPQRTFRESYPDELRHFLGDLPEDQEGAAPRLTFAVGGAGAQVELVEQFLPELAPRILDGRWRVALVAGVRQEVADRFRDALTRCGLDQAPRGSVEVLCETDHDRYFRAFNCLMSRTDVLWSKPSELSFFGALGLAFVAAKPVGVHERYNRRWMRESGAALKQRWPRHAAQWLQEWLDDGLLAGCAWSGFQRLPKFGLYRILKLVNGRSDATADS